MVARLGAFNSSVGQTQTAAKSNISLAIPNICNDFRKLETYIISTSAHGSSRDSPILLDLFGFSLQLVNWSSSCIQSSTIDFQEAGTKPPYFFLLKSLQLLRGV